MPDTKMNGAAAAARMRAAAHQVAVDVQRLPPDLITWVPGEGVWTVMDNLCHIREFVPFWTHEIQRMIGAPAEPWGRDHTDTARLTAVSNTSGYRLDDVLADIRAGVEASATVLAGLTGDALATEATSRNPRWGTKPASFVVDHLLVGHLEKHLGQIRRNVAQYSAKMPLLFPAAPQPTVPVRGQAHVVPLHRIFCVGRNYEAHAKEMGVAVDREAPFYFTKASWHYVPSGATVPYPPGTSNYHYEMELVVVIGQPAYHVPVDRALDCIFGYACGLDMTRRDLQFAAREQKRPWDLGKDVEQSAVISEIVPAAACGHPTGGVIELRVNGETRQQSDVSLLIHSVPEVVSHLSRFYHLQPGDVVFTGTPEGVGPVKPGDRLEGSVAGVGTIELTIGSPA